MCFNFHCLLVLNETLDRNLTSGHLMRLARPVIHLQFFQHLHLGKRIDLLSICLNQPILVLELEDRMPLLSSRISGTNLLPSCELQA